MFKTKNFICQDLPFHSISWQRCTYKYRTHVRLGVCHPRKFIIKRIAKQRMFVFSLQYFCFLCNCFRFIRAENTDLVITVLVYTNVHYLTNLMLALFLTTSTFFFNLKCSIFTVILKKKKEKSEILLSFRVVWKTIVKLRLVSDVQHNTVSGSKFWAWDT